MVNPAVLYSANTWLAHQISKRFYGGLHWVWCSPHFNARSVLARDVDPRSRTPGDIFLEFQEITRRGDRRNPKIAANKSGLLNGVVSKMRAGAIDGPQATKIVSMIDAAELIDFRPMMYVIPVNGEVEAVLKEVPIQDRANPLSAEYIIERLRRELFDIIEPL